MLIFTTTGPYPLAMVATPLFLLALIVFFVFQAFSDSVGDGIRSFAAVLPPLMTIALLVGFRRDKLREKKEALQEGSAQAFPSALAFTLTLLAGIGVLALLVITPTGVPLPELVLSGYPPEDLVLRPAFVERAAGPNRTWTPTACGAGRWPPWCCPR